MSPSSAVSAPAASFAYVLGNGKRRTIIKTPTGNQVVESPTHVLQGKVVSLGQHQLKQSRNGSNYYIVRVAVGEQGFAMVTGYDHLAKEFLALSVGDVIQATGKWRRETRFDPQAGGDVVTNWFTAREYNLVASAPEPPAPAPALQRADAPGDVPFTDDDGSYIAEDYV